MNKQRIVIIVIIAVLLFALLATAGYFFWAWVQKESALRDLEKNGALNDEMLQDATKGALPSLETDALKNKPDINPVDNANPIKDIKINPFD